MKKFIAGIFLISNTALFCVGGWNKGGYQPIATQADEGESEQSFMLRLKNVMELQPNEITFIRAVRDNNREMVEQYLKTTSFVNNATPGLFTYASTTAKKQGNTSLANKLAKYAN